MRLAELLDALDYTAFPQYYLKTDREHSPDIVPLFRSAKDAGVDGIYVVQSSPQDKNILPVRPAVYVAEAQTPEQAREIHRALWNSWSSSISILWIWCLSCPSLSPID